MKPVCPNCIEPVDNHPDNACVLGAFIVLVRDRENLSEAALRDLHLNCNVDMMWERLRPILDDLEAGIFSQDEDLRP